MEVDQGLVMERSQEQLTDALLESSTKLPLNILASDSHPSDLILALLSEAVYTEKKPRETDAHYGKRQHLPKDWCLLATGSNPEWINGYFGAAYVHIKWQQVVVAHRGTVLSNAGSLITDAFGICWDKYTDCANTAITFADRIRQALHFVNTEHGRNYNLAITGHSLGGWLAQITSFTVKWLNASDGLLMKNTSDKDHAKTVVFDSPGARDMLEKVRDDHYDRLGNNFLERLDITVYVSAPNYVNTCGKHIGTVNRIIIDVSSFDWKVKLSTVIYTEKTHAISNFVKSLRNNSRVIKVLDWPKNSNELSKLLGRNALNLANKYHETFDRVMYDLILSKQTKRYNTEEGIMTKCYLKAFSDGELQILNKLNSIQKQADFSVINKLVLNKNLEIKKNDDVFPNFEIDHNNLTLSCESKQSLEKLTHRLKQLMRWLGQEFTEAVEEQFAALPRAADLFYRAEGQSYLDSLPKCSLNFTDSIGLQEFLLSDTVRVLSIVTQDGVVEMARLRNIFSQLRDNILFSAPNEKYTSDSHFTFLDWPRLQKLLKSGRSPIDQNNLMMVDGSLCTTFSSESWTFLNNYKQSFPSVLKKLVFISTHPIEILNSFENIKTFNVHRKINLIDLSEDSQKVVLQRNIISTGKTAYTFAEFLGEDYSISEINEFLCSDFKKILTNNDYVITIKDTRPRLSDQQMPIFETNIITDMKCVLKCVNSPNTLVVMSRKEVEILAGWEQLTGTEIILAEGDAEEIFRETCNENQQNSVYRLQVSNEDIYCKQIFNEDFYVSRNFFHRARIDVRNFAQTKHSEDLFVVHSIEDKTFLVGLIRNCKESEAFILSIKVTGTKEREAELIQKNLQKNLHFIKICQNEMGCEIEWRYSHGSLETLKSYVSTESYDPIDEQTLSKTEKQMVIITDEPGMGKTTSLANLSRRVETPWVIYIELKNFQAHIRDKLPNGPLLTPRNVASFLLSESRCADNSLEHKFLIYLLQSKTSTKRVALMFDGFDEVDDYIINMDSSKEKLVKLFNYLVNKPNIQLFLATRTYLKESLEEKLTQFSTSFVPISEKNQLNFLMMFWRSCLFLELGHYGEVEEGRLKEYAEEVLRQAKQVLGPDMARFMGVPLQLRMLAEIFRPQSDLLIQSTDALFKNINIVSAPNLYKRFISLKCDIYMHEKTIKGKVLSDDEIKTYLEPLTKLHGKLSFKTLFPEFYRDNFETIEDRELVNLNRLGLVQSKGKGEFYFVHRTYAEYCCAQIIVMWLDQQESAFKYQLIKDIILPKVLLQSDSKVIRLFLNVELGEMKMSDTTLQSNAEQISQLWLKTNIIFRNDDNQTALHIAVKEKNEHIMELLLSGLHYESTQEDFVSLINQYDNNNDTVLHIMDQPTFYGKTEDDALCNRIMRFFFKSIVNCPRESIEAILLAYVFNRDISESHVSNYLLKSGNISGNSSIIFKNIINRLKQVQLQIIPFNKGLLKNKVKLAKTILCKKLNNTIQRYLVLLNGPKEYVTWLHFAAQKGHLGIVRLLAEQSSDILTILLTRRDNNKKTPLLIAAEGGHLDIVKLLVERGANMNTRCKLGKTALMYAAFYRYTTIVKYLIDSDAEINAKDNYGRTALYIAAGKDNLSVVRYLIEGGAEMNSQDNDGWSALHIAVGNDNSSIVKYLIEKGVMINLKDNSGTSALHYATENSNLSLVKYLTERGAEINTLNHSGRTPLHVAVGNKNVSILTNIFESVEGIIFRNRTARHKKVMGNVNQLIIKYLIESGAEINSVGNNGETVLHIAKVNNNLSIVKYLIERGAEEHDGSTALEMTRGKDSNFSTVNNLTERGAEINSIDNNFRTELHVAVSRNNLSTVKYLIESGTDINSKDNVNKTALHIALDKDFLSLMKYLIESGAEINSKDNDGRTALHLAVGKEKIFFVKYLIEFGADINCKDNVDGTALHLALSKDNLLLVKYLIESGADINSKDVVGRTALHLSLGKDNLSLVKYFIEIGADINSKDNVGRTVLHLALGKGNFSLARYLLENGADINCKDNVGRTALHLALGKDFFWFVKYLIESGANINSKDNDGRTVLHIAVDKDNLSLVKYLIESGAEINSVGNEGWTALHIAASNGNLSIVKYLIECGAEINSINNEGRTALHIAVINDIFSIVKYLMESGAEINCTDNDGRTAFNIADSSKNFLMALYLAKTRAEINFTADVLEKNCLIKGGAEIIPEDNDGSSASEIARSQESGVEINSMDKNFKTELLIAVSKNNLSAVKYLIEHGADINSINDNDHMTALHVAVNNNNFLMAKYLIEGGANINSKDNIDKTALHLALDKDYLSLMKYLIESGAEINSKDNDGRTILHIAVRKDNLSLVKYLIECGAEINSKDNDGGTTLHEAAYKGHLPVLEYLLQQGADPNRVDRSGRTALTLASWNKKWDAVRVLMEKGADVNADGGKALAKAVWGGEWTKVKCFIDKGALIQESKIQRNLSEFKKEFPNYQFKNKII